MEAYISDYYTLSGNCILIWWEVIYEIFHYKLEFGLIDILKIHAVK